MLSHPMVNANKPTDCEIKIPANLAETSGVSIYVKKALSYKLDNIISKLKLNVIQML